MLTDGLLQSSPACRWAVCRGGDKELRNELVVLAYLMASDDAGKEALLVEGVVSTLMHLAVSPELRPIPVDYRKTFGTVDALDLQFRELVWNTMHM